MYASALARAHASVLVLSLLFFDKTIIIIQHYYNAFNMKLYLLIIFYALRNGLRKKSVRDVLLYELLLLCIMQGLLTF